MTIFNLVYLLCDQQRQWSQPGPCVSYASSLNPALVFSYASSLNPALGIRYTYSPIQRLFLTGKSTSKPSFITGTHLYFWLFWFQGYIMKVPGLKVPKLQDPVNPTRHGFLHGSTVAFIIITTTHAYLSIQAGFIDRPRRTPTRRHVVTHNSVIFYIQ